LTSEIHMNKGFSKQNTKDMVLMIVFVFVMLLVLILVDILLDPSDIPIL
jgi:hypothetical protein